MRISEPAEYAILGLLHQRPMYGYEMFSEFENGVLGQVVHLEMSQMYAFMKKLERLRYIEAQLEAQGSRPPRKVYHLTQAGQDLFFSWLQAPVLRPRDVRILFLIKLYFVLRYIPTEMQRLIAQQIEASRSFLEQLEARQSGFEATGNEAFFNEVMLRGRIYQTRSQLDWLRELQESTARWR